MLILKKYSFYGYNAMMDKRNEQDKVSKIKKMAAIKLDPSAHQKSLEKRRQTVREWRKKSKYNLVY